MSCSSAVDHQAVPLARSRSRAATRSAARWVATPCSRKRSGIVCQTAVRSKKSYVRARLAIDWIVAGCSTSTAPQRSPRARATDRRPGWRDAARRSPARHHPRPPRRSPRSTGPRPRTAAAPGCATPIITGNASSASNAWVSRRPWPSLCRRSREAYGSVVAISYTVVVGAKRLSSRRAQLRLRAAVLRIDHHTSPHRQMFELG